MKEELENIKPMPIKTEKTELAKSKDKNLDSPIAEIVRAEMKQMEAFSGPLPRPADFREYEDIMPGAANRIMELAEREAAHRHATDNFRLKTESRDSLLGIISAAVLCSGTISAGTIIALSVPSTAGTVVGGILGASGLFSVFGVMIKSTRTSWQSDNQK